jgi:hypothetical protein
MNTGIIFAIGYLILEKVCRTEIIYKYNLNIHFMDVV